MAFTPSKPCLPPEPSRLLAAPGIPVVPPDSGRGHTGDFTQVAPHWRGSGFQDLWEMVPPSRGGWTSLKRQQQLPGNPLPPDRVIDPDACHQCSTGMCCRDSGLELGTSWSWLLTKCSAHSSRHLILQQEPPPPPARLFCTPRDRWGLSEDWIQSVSLTIVLLSDKETQGRGSLKDT